MKEIKHLTEELNVAQREEAKQAQEEASRASHKKAV